MALAATWLSLKQTHLIERAQLVDFEEAETPTTCLASLIAGQKQ